MNKYRTHTCGQLTIKEKDKQVKWISDTFYELIPIIHDVDLYVANKNKDEWRVFLRKNLGERLRNKTNQTTIKLNDRILPKTQRNYIIIRRSELNLFQDDNAIYIEHRNGCHFEELKKNSNTIEMVSQLIKTKFQRTIDKYAHTCMHVMHKG